MKLSKQCLKVNEDHNENRVVVDKPFINQSSTSSLRSLQRMARPLVAGNEGAGYESAKNICLEAIHHLFLVIFWENSR